jgi:hypothetical protein
LKIGKIEDFENPDREIGKDDRNHENPAGIGKVGRYGKRTVPIFDFMSLNFAVLTASILPRFIITQ